MVNLGVTMQVCALALFCAAVLTWYPPTPGEALWDLPHRWLPAGPYIAGPLPLERVRSLDLTLLPDDEADQLAPGEGSVSSILALDDDPALQTAQERQAAIDAWVHEPAVTYTLDWSRVDAALQRFLAPLDSVDLARIELDNMWRLETATGEIPRIPALTGA